MRSDAKISKISNSKKVRDSSRITSLVWILEVEVLTVKYLVPRHGQIVRWDSSTRHARIVKPGVTLQSFLISFSEEGVVLIVSFTHKVLL